MKKAVLFGCGGGGYRLYNSLKSEVEFICAVDNNTKKHGSVWADGIAIQSPQVLRSLEFDVVYIAALGCAEQMHRQLIEELHIPEHKINANSTEIYERAKWLFTFSFAKYCRVHGIAGSVAEAGVYQGNFSKEINRYFPDRTLYLFDTFRSFDERDLQIEDLNNFSKRESDFFDNTSEELVLSKLPHPEKVVVKKGYFPETFDLQNERFCFVNLDMDLYKPTKDGLRVFYPLMVRGGVILVHDYFNDDYLGAGQALDEFVNENALVAMPIGDDFSMAIVKS